MIFKISNLKFKRNLKMGKDFVLDFSIVDCLQLIIGGGTGCYQFGDQ